MKRSEWFIIALAFTVLMVWGLVRYTNLQSELSESINMPIKAQIKEPKLSPSIKQLFSPQAKSFLAMNSEQLWGFAPIMALKKPNPYEIIFTPRSNGTGTRVCVTTSCYEFMGLMGNKALFYDLNLSATKKTVLVRVGDVLHKPLRVKKIAPDSVVLIDTKTKTTYEMSLFKIDLTPYTPIQPPKKGK